MNGLPERLAGLEPPEIQEVCREAIDGYLVRCAEMERRV